MRTLTRLATWLAQAFYSVLKAVLPARRKVVFLSRQSNSPSRDFTLLAEELSSRDRDLEVVTRCRLIDESTAGRIAYLGEIVRQIYHLSTARACVVDGYVIPVSILEHRPGLIIIQMWHALGAIKKFGYQSLDRPSGRSSELADAMRMHRNYDVVLCGGPATVEVFAEAFGVDPSVVKPLGLPRVDYLLSRAGDALPSGASLPVQRLMRRFPVLSDSSRLRILYAPTFRRNGKDRYQEVAGRFADDRYTLIVKPHPLVSASVDGANVVNAESADILDLLPLGDVVITDYSAVAFEACVLDKPLYFYVYDIDEYTLEHGLNIDLLSDMPGIAYRDLEDIAGRIESGVYDPAPILRFKELYVSVAQGGCTSRIADLVMNPIPGV